MRRKKDLYLIGGVLVAALLLGGYQHFVRGVAGTEVLVTQNGEVMGRYLLSERKELIFTDERGGRNTLVIGNWEANIIDADCPDKLCVRQKPISKKGESIICLPHRLVIEIIRGEENEVDAVAG